MAADVTVRAALEYGGALSGLYTTADNVVLADGNLVLAPSEGDPTLRDIYRAQVGPWARATDVTLTRWMDILVLDGDPYQNKSGLAGSLWTLATAGPYPRDGSAPLHFRLRQKQPHPTFLGGLEETSDGTVRMPTRTGVEGTYSSLGGTVTAQGVLMDVFETETGATYLEGLKVSWESTSSLRIAEGSAFVPASGRLTLAADEVLVFPGDASLTANTWYYIYLFENNGQVQVEVSEQRPATPYLGASRVKGGGTGGVLDNTNPDIQPDETRRYIPRSAFKTHPTLANTILRRRVNGGWVSYIEDEATTLRLFSGANNNGSRIVRSAAPLVPPTSRLCRMRINTNGTSGVYYDANEGPTNAVLVGSARTSFPEVDLDALQQFGQQNVGAGGASDFGVLGFYEEA